MEKEKDASEVHPSVISLREWAGLNNVSYKTAYQAARAGQIPGAFKVRAHWRIPADSRATVKLPTLKGISEEWIGMPKSLTINGVLYVRADTVR